MLLFAGSSFASSCANAAPVKLKPRTQAKTAILTA
jgi:hypothetical protein